MELNKKDRRDILRAALIDLCNEAQVTNSLCGQQIMPADQWAILTEQERHVAVQAHVDMLTASPEQINALTRAAFVRATQLSHDLTFIEERRLQA